MRIDIPDLDYAFASITEGSHVQRLIYGVPLGLRRGLRAELWRPGLYRRYDAKSNTLYLIARSEDGVVARYTVRGVGTTEADTLFLACSGSISTSRILSYLHDGEDC